MKVIDKRYKDTVSFDFLKVGSTFIDVNNYYPTVYMKILSVDYGGYKFNAINLLDGSLVGYDDDCYVIAVEAEVSYK